MCSVKAVVSCFSFAPASHPVNVGAESKAPPPSNPRIWGVHAFLPDIDVTVCGAGEERQRVGQRQVDEASDARRHLGGAA